MRSSSAPPEQKQSPAPPLPLLKPASTPLTGEVFAKPQEQWLCSSFWYIPQGRENTPQNHQPVHQLLNYKIIIIKFKKKTKPQIVTDANGWDAAPCPGVIRISRKHTRAFQTPMCCSTALPAPASSCPHQCHQQQSIPTPLGSGQGSCLKDMTATERKIQNLHAMTTLFLSRSHTSIARIITPSASACLSTEL